MADRTAAESRKDRVLCWLTPNQDSGERLVVLDVQCQSTKPAGQTRAGPAKAMANPRERASEGA